MIHIIYMAAGNSRRLSNKLFYELDGKPMYRHLLDHLIEIKDRYNKLKNAESNNPVIDITVVTLSGNTGLLRMYPGLPCSLKSGQRKRHSLHHKAGIMAVQEQKKTGMKDYYMFAVADQPYLKVKA
ncbi:MAG: NTP transferase domain-containing protein [Agathobacter rectalis]